MKNEDENINNLNNNNIINIEYKLIQKKREFNFSNIFLPLILSSIGLILIILVVIILTFSSKKNNSNNKWEPQGNHIKTKWSYEIDINNVFPEHPRPNFQRNDWINLNGLWEFTVIDMEKQYGIKLDKNNKTNYLNSIKNIKNLIIPTEFNETKILVPFPIESSLSGIQRNLTEKEELWYKREITIPKKFKNKRILLHFDAVDWNCTVFINEKQIGNHIGGYTPFSFDITDFLSDKKQTIHVRVFDPTDSGYQPVGKQKKNSTSPIFYTPSSGIWQSVWIEPVDKLYITNYKIIPDVDNNAFKLKVSSSSEIKNNGIIVRIFNDFEDILQTFIYECDDESEITIGIPKNKIFLWSPDAPYLYNIEIKLFKGAKTNDIHDTITGYFALRKISKIQDEKFHFRIQLNNKQIFSLGPLDQGFWPDGLYTPPTNEAIKNDIEKVKELGFNSIRKHIKIEPARWYYYCDKIGVMVWQDIPSGDIGENIWDPSDFNKGTDVNRTDESINDFYLELTEMVNTLFNYPSIVIWVPFNEAWGQFQTEKVTEFIYNLDNSRLINSASGGNYRYTGDFLDLHTYTTPEKKLHSMNYINVIGEYGGIGLYLEKNSWGNNSWAYIILNNTEEVTIEYENLAEQMIKLINEGFSAGIYTQLTDVECEVNGLFSYDRKEYKIIKDRIRFINKKIINSLK